MCVQNDPVCAPAPCGCAPLGGACKLGCPCCKQGGRRSGDCAISARGDLPGPHGGAVRKELALPANQGHSTS